MTPRLNLPLYAIEDALAELLTARGDLLQELAGEPASDGRGVAVTRSPEEVGAELAQVESTLAEYIGRELRKVDGIHSAINRLSQDLEAAKRERSIIGQRIGVIDGSLKRLKALCVDVMASFGKERLEGTAGRYIARQGNGGLQPLQVDGWDSEKEQWKVNLDEVPLPDGLCDVVVKMPADSWDVIVRTFEMSHVRVMGTEPAVSRIREALASCTVCGGTGSFPSSYEPMDVVTPIAGAEECSRCNGTGRQLVPGARLLPRGEHLRVK